jgi:hypothetical protein
MSYKSMLRQIDDKPSSKQTLLFDRAYDLVQLLHLLGIKMNKPLTALYLSRVRMRDGRP